MAKVPGVLSLMAMKFIRSSGDIHPWEYTSDCMRGIIAYPPPKVKSPILKKVKNNFKRIIAFLLFYFFVVL
jgi:hypothetical protein